MYEKNKKYYIFNFFYNIIIFSIPVDDLPLKSIFYVDIK